MSRLYFVVGGHDLELIFNHVNHKSYHPATIKNLKQARRATNLSFVLSPILRCIILSKPSLSIWPMKINFDRTVINNIKAIVGSKHQKN